MKIVTEIEFPCGYKFEQVIMTGWFDNGHYHDDDGILKECPLHGKECKRVKP